jgi:hypothetical protein
MSTAEGNSRFPGVTETEHDQRFGEHPQPEASRQAEAWVCARPVAVVCHARCPYSRTLVQPLAERRRQCVHVEACGRTPISPEEQQEVIVKIDEPTRFPVPQGMRWLR